MEPNDVKYPRKEIHTCDSCGRDFAVILDDSTEDSVQSVFCPTCLRLSPYLLEEDD